MTYNYKPIDEVREDVIGLKVIDVEAKGMILYLENEEGRSYAIDFTGKDGAVVHKGTTEKENIEDKLLLFDLLLEKLDISEEELWELYE